MKNNLIIGGGEVGSSLASILKGSEVFDIDPTKNLASRNQYRNLHVCFPYSKDFVKSVRKYQKRFKPSLTIVHSTIPLGTSRKLKAVHSPVRGIHPYLAKSLKIFPKFFGGSKAKLAAEIFDRVGIKTLCTPKSETTEAMKLWDTTIYGINIVLEKEIYKFCEENDVDFDVVYTKANQSYNDGYRILGRPEYQKYVLSHTPGAVGGHCVVPNASLLKSSVAKWLRDENTKFAKGSNRQE